MQEVECTCTDQVIIAHPLPFSWGSSYLMVNTQPVKTNAHGLQGPGLDVIPLLLSIRSGYPTVMMS